MLRSNLLSARKSLTACAMILALFWFGFAGAQPDPVADEYMGSGGYGIGVEKISNPSGTGGDSYRDVIATHLTNPGDCLVNLNSQTPPYLTYLWLEDIAPGRQARFGQLRLNSPKDLAVSEAVINTYRNNNDGTLNWFGPVLNAPTGLDWIAWGRINDDDLLEDIIACDYNWFPYLYVFYANLNGTLNPDYDQFDTGADADQVQVEDLDYFWWSSLAEIIIVSNNSLKIYEHDGQTPFSPTLRQTIDVGGPVWDYVVGDLNRDDYKDIVACTQTFVKTYVNDRTGHFDYDDTYTFQNAFEQVALTEYDYDGYPDLVANNAELVCVYPDLGNGKFGSVPVWTGTMDVAMYVVCNELVTADLTGTGAQSILCTGQEMGTYSGLWLFKDNGDPSPCPPKNLTAIEEDNHPKLMWAFNLEDDMDADPANCQVYREITRPDEIPRPTCLN